MKIDEITEIYQLISKSSEDLSDRKQTSELRKVGFQTLLQPEMKKLAFDTRRIDQGHQIIPRRGLQNFQRSSAFITKAMGDKVKNLSRLHGILGEIKQVHGSSQEWKDSNVRVLLSTVENGLRSHQGDLDITESQPGVGNLDYIQQLLHVRYRLDLENLGKVASSEIKRIVLSKDENLVNKDVNDALMITKNDIMQKDYTDLLEKLFAGASSSDGEKTITITIKNKVGA